MITFQDRHVIISGGGSGIGRSSALKLAALGAHVTIVGPHETSLAEVASHDAAHIIPVVCDVLDTEKWTSLIRHKRDLDILVNCAAVSLQNDILDQDDAAWDQVLHVNFQAAVNGARAAVHAMSARGGRIVNVTSVHGHLCEAKSSAYGIGKAALNQFTKCLAMEAAPLGILVNAVAPGFVDTPMSRVTGVNELETDWFKNNFLSNGRIPLRRAALPDEIAQAILFLASPENTYITGQILTVDGGLTLTL